MKLEPQPELAKASIVELQEGDWEKYKQIRLESLRQDPSAFGRSYEGESLYADEQWKERLRKNATQPQESMFLVALQDSGPIGCIGGFRRKDGIWVLNAVYFSPAYRGKGISDQLVKTALERIKVEPEAKVVELTVNVRQVAAVKVYQRHGFTITETLKGQKMGDGNTYDEYVMRKELDDPEA